LNNAQIRALLGDCLTLWDVAGTVVVREDHIAIDTPVGVFAVARADTAIRPVRWFYQTPERAAAGRAPRAVPSIVALLSALRNALDGMGGDRLRIGGG
jgi:hypothetical protein